MTLFEAIFNEGSSSRRQVNRRIDQAHASGVAANNTLWAKNTKNYENAMARLTKREGGGDSNRDKAQAARRGKSGSTYEPLG